jgi:hypothetical protein
MWQISYTRNLSCKKIRGVFVKMNNMRRGRIVGLVRHLGKVVWGQLHRGFESLPLRQGSIGANAVD